MARGLRSMPHNVRYILPLESIWAVFGGMLFFYTPVYMRALGLGDMQIGLVSTVGLFIGCLSTFFAAPLTNKYGRRWTLIIWDVLSWGPAMLLWGLSQNVWFFVAAVIFNSFGKVAYVAWICLLVEDSPPERRAGIFAALSTIISLSAVFTPIAALLFERYGLVPTMRVLFLVGGVCMMGAFLVRHHFVRETQPGLALMAVHKDHALMQGVMDFIRELPLLLRSRDKTLFALIYILTSYVMAFNVFNVIYLNEQLRFNEGILSLSPLISGLLNVVLVVMLIPRLRAVNEVLTLSASFVISLTGVFIFLLIPAGNVLLFLVSVTLTAGGSYLMTTFRDTAFMNSLGEHEKANAFSGVQTLSAVATVPAGIIAGAIYSAAPRLLFMVIIVIHAVCMILSLLILRHRKGDLSIKAAETADLTSR